MIDQYSWEPLKSYDPEMPESRACALKSWPAAVEVTIGSSMATAEDEDETTNILDALAREYGQSTGNTEGSELSTSERYSTFTNAD